MIMTDKNGITDVKNSILSTLALGGATNGNSHESEGDSESSSDDEHEPMMRVGHDYQAVIPDLVEEIRPPGQRGGGENHAEAMLVWSPSPEMPEEKLDEYIRIAKEKYGYNCEQALGMLFWHNHSIEKSLSDLPNFTPFPDEWSVEDKVLFEQSFSFHGKSFNRIRQMLPDKTISSLVKYYYNWKKLRTRTSLMDRQARKLITGKDNSGSDDNSEEESAANNAVYKPPRKIDKTSLLSSLKTHNHVKKEVPISVPVSRNCANCSTSVSNTFPSDKGLVCCSCLNHWRRAGSWRSSGGSAKENDPGYKNVPKGKLKPPRGMNLSQEDLTLLCSGQGQGYMRQMDSDAINLKRQVQFNKQVLSQQKALSKEEVDDFRPAEATSRPSARWTNDDCLIAVQAIRKYGRDYEAVADVIGNKNDAQVKSFFINYRRRYNLDQVLEEYEKENTSKQASKSASSGGGSGGDDPEMDTTSPPLPPVGGTATAPPPLLKGSTSQSGTSSKSRENNKMPSIQSAAPRLLQPKPTLQQPPPLIRPTSTATPLTSSQSKLAPNPLGVETLPPQLVSSQPPPTLPTSSPSPSPPQ